MLSHSTKSKAMYAVIFSLSIYIFIHYVVKNSHIIYYDENVYWDLAKQIRMNGLFNFTNDIRTYFYPFLISLVVLVTGESLGFAKITMSILQYFLYIYTVLLIAKTAYEFSSKKVIYFSILFLGLTSLYLISACTLFLTDLTSACLMTISFVYLTTKDLHKVKNALIISCCLYASVMIRPSASLFLMIFFVIAIYRIIKERKYNVWKFVIIGILSLVLFYPQIHMNITKYKDYTPLVHSKLYKFQTTEAVKMLKYGTIVIPNEKPQLVYNSPFTNPKGTTIYNLLYMHPLQFVVIFTSHIFGLFDWEYVNTYIYNLAIKQKFIPSIYLYFQWFLIIIGILATFKKKWNAILFPSILFSVIIYTLFMGTTTVESRFGFPNYMLLLPFIGFGVNSIVENIKNKNKIILLRYGFLFVIYCLIMLFGSYLMDQQTGRIHWF